MSAAPGFLFAILGLVGGSFATAASHRLATGEPMATDRSRCPHCHHVLSAADLVPVASWLWRRGKCAYCGVRISWRYPAIELSATALFVLAWTLNPANPIVAGLLALTALGLLVIVVADLEAFIIPDAALICMIPLALGWRWITANGFADTDSWLDAAAGAAAGFIALFAVREAFRRWRGIEGMGFGDVKFTALAGFYIGFTGLPVFLIMSGISGVLFGILWRIMGKGHTFPFGPALCLALLLKLMLPDFFQWP